MNGTVALYGGTFNPPHLGHRSVLETVCKAYDNVVLMPAFKPPHKKNLPCCTPEPGHRMAMAELLAEDFPNVAVSDHEMSTRRACYTSDTLDWLEGRYGEPALIVGSDMFLTLHEWHEHERIMTRAELAVLYRQSYKGDDVERAARLYYERWGARVRFLEHEPVEISSTMLRAQLTDENTRRSVSGLPERVRSYIMKHKLYGG